MTDPLQLEKGMKVRFSKTAPENYNRSCEPDIGQIGEYCGIMHHHENGDHSILFKWENDNPFDTFVYDHCCLRSQIRKLPDRKEG